MLQTTLRRTVGLGGREWVRGAEEGSAVGTGPGATSPRSLPSPIPAGVPTVGAGRDLLPLRLPHHALHPARARGRAALRPEMRRRGVRELRHR